MKMMDDINDVVYIGYNEQLLEGGVEINTNNY
jgi:hypothetical protein